MPQPIPVDLQPHSPAWQPAAEHEAQRLADALGPHLIVVHHIGSTAIADIVAKPILDLIPVVFSITAFDACRSILLDLGYEWWGEYGMAGRRYATLTDGATGQRCIQLHIFEQGSRHIERHLAFRDYLRANPEKAREYEAVKLRSRDRHPSDSHAYTDAKSAWIRATEVEAVEFYRGR
ncbi:GrpB family protein [Kaistia terrae]|uniref:GrpB family protein n=1 Tax=Kaistia terrae TaxID=537017 RepID=A0ABW0Q0W3_9HYPH|nr:GrpB family protein [Kaistia terrae]MCX5580727.1 GrpB family protein [Kaistia terrae]